MEIDLYWNWNGVLMCFNMISIILEHSWLWRMWMCVCVCLGWMDSHLWNVNSSSCTRKLCGDDNKPIYVFWIMFSESKGDRERKTETEKNVIIGRKLSYFIHFKSTQAVSAIYMVCLQTASLPSEYNRHHQQQQQS